MAIVNYNKTQRDIMKNYLYGSTANSGSAFSTGSSSSAGSLSNLGSFSSLSSLSSAGSAGSVCTIAQQSDTELLQAFINKIVEDFPSGNLSQADLERMFKILRIDIKLKRSVLNNNVVCYTFTALGKKYTITCSNKKACESGIDNKRITCWSKSYIISITGISSEKLFDKYFEVVAKVENSNGKNDVNLQYKLKTEYYGLSLTDLKKMLLKECEKIQETVIINNFMNDYKDNTATEVDDVRHMKTFNTDNKNISVTYKNYLDYENKINDETTEYTISQIVEKLIKDFTSGNLTIPALKAVLNAIDITPTIVEVNGKIKVSFSYNYEQKGFIDGSKILTKTYEITCDKNSATMAHDNIQQYTSESPTHPELKELFDEYFESCFDQNGKTKLYALKAGKSLDKYNAKASKILNSAKLSKNGNNELTLFILSVNKNVLEKSATNAIRQLKKSDDIIVYNFAEMIYNIINDLGLNNEQALELVYNIGQEIAKKVGNSNLTNSALQKFFKNNRKNLAKTLQDIVENTVAKTKFYTQEEINNINSINYDSLLKSVNTFNKTTSPTTTESSISVGELLGLPAYCCNDPGVKKFLQILESAYDKFIDYTFDRKIILHYIIKFLNEKVGIQSDPPKLSQETFNNPNFFEDLESIINSKKLENAVKIGSDKVIDDFSQGNEGDCWLLAGLQSLSSSSEGAKLIADAMVWNDDYSKVTIKFAGTGDKIVLTIDEILDFKDENCHASGDIDVIIIELAFKKLLGSINGLDGLNVKFSDSFYKYFVNGDIATSTGTKYDDALNAIGGLFGVSNGKTDMDKKTAKNFLQNILDNKNSGKYAGFAATFALFTTADSATWSWETTSGRTETFEMGYSAHVFAITDITSNTVTFANPHDSSEEYTVTWEEFAKIGIAQMAVTYF